MQMSRGSCRVSVVDKQTTEGNANTLDPRHLMHDALGMSCSCTVASGLPKGMTPRWKNKTVIDEASPSIFCEYLNTIHPREQKLAYQFN